MIRDKNFDFSFSGLKTALLYALQNDKSWKKRVPEYAAEFQAAVADVLVTKTIKAAKQLNCKNVMLSGGVAANLELRNRLKMAVEEKLDGAKLIIPDLKYCTDNAAMIAAAGYFRAKKKDFTPWRKLKTDANQELK
jgi:N6-L-threonylcarbamoyladenine synthase